MVKLLSSFSLPSNERTEGVLVGPLHRQMEREHEVTIATTIHSRKGNVIGPEDFLKHRTKYQTL